MQLLNPSLHKDGWQEDLSHIIKFHPSKQVVCDALSFNPVAW
jgi:hypothetical protein